MGSGRLWSHGAPVGTDPELSVTGVSRARTVVGKVRSHCDLVQGLLLRMRRHQQKYSGVTAK